MATNKQVVEAWGNGRAMSSNNLHTDGMGLFSYDLLIGYTAEPNFLKVLIDYTAKGGEFVSVTTSSRHIAPAREFADVTVTPLQFKEHSWNAHNPPEVEPTLDPWTPVGG